MSEHPASAKIVESLCHQGLLTEDQAKRVRQAVESGKDLVWAFSHLPLVEPLQFLKAQSLLGAAAQRTGRSGATPSPLAPSSTYEVKPVAPGSEMPTPLPTQGFATGEPGAEGMLNLEDLEEDVPTLEIEDKDYAAGFEGVGRPAEMSSFEETPVPTLHTPLPMTETPRPKRPPTTSSGTSAPVPEVYMRPGVTPSTYDLSDDEGIPLVNRVNGLLAEAVGTGVRRLVFRRAGAEMEIASISEFGTDGATQPLSMDEGAKICNRLKIMARVEPWRKPPQKGMFQIQQARRQARVLVDIDVPPDAPETEEITLHFLPTF